VAPKTQRAAWLVVPVLASACGAGPPAKPPSPTEPSVRALAPPLSARVLRAEVAIPVAPNPAPAALVAREAPEPAIELDAEEPRSALLPCGLANPMPGGVTAGYAADTGLDLGGAPRDVYAIAAGTIDYAEAGHTLWDGPHDSPYAIRIKLDAPIPAGDRRVTHVWYAHLSALAREVHEGSGEVVHVAAGRRLGTSGFANGCAHLHLGLLLDGEVEQHRGTFLLEDKVRTVLCGIAPRTMLPPFVAE